MQATSKSPRRRLRWRWAWRLALTVAGLGAFSAHALDPGKPFTQYAQRTWSYGQGLPQIGATTVTQDHDGYMWFGTIAGLSRFDGERFTNFDLDNAPQLPSTWITALLTDAGGRVWIGTLRGLARYERGVFTTIPAVAGTVTSVDISAVTSQADGQVLAGSGQTLYAVGADERLHARAQLPARIRSLLAVPDGVWIGTRQSVHLLRGDRLTEYPLPAPADVRQLRIVDGQLLAGTANGLFALRHGTWQVHADPRLAHAPIEHMTLDRDGNLWVTTSDQALVRLRGLQVREVIDLSGKLPYLDDLYSAIYEDRDAGLWLTSSIDGVMRVSDGAVIRHRPDDASIDPGYWTTLALPDGRILAAGEEGVQILREGRMQPFIAPDALPASTVYTLMAEGDRLWVGTARGVVLFVNGRRQPMAGLESLPQIGVNAILRTTDGQLWVGTSQGLCAVYPTAPAQCHLPQGGATRDIVTLLQTRDGRLLAGGSSGLYAWDGSALRAIQMTADGHAPSIFALHQLPDGQLLAGAQSEEGLYLLANGHWTLLSSRQGIPRNSPYAIADDGQGLVWVAGQTGVYRVGVDDLLNAAGPSHARVAVQRLVDADSSSVGNQPYRCCNGGGMGSAFLRDGHLWVAAGQGLLDVSPAHQQEAHAPITPVIERLHFDQQWHSAMRLSSLALPHGARDVQLEFSSPSFDALQPTGLQYRLEGYEQRWHVLEPGADRAATYTNLPAGTYRFVVKASRSGQATRIRQLSLELPPYWYERRPVQWLMGLMLLASLSLLYLWQVRRHRSRSAALERLVQARTRDLFNANQQLEATSRTDPLTGLYNRRHVSQQIPRDIQVLQHQPSRSGLVLALLDIDHFKTINDTYGHRAGDSVLQAISRELSRQLRQEDYVARWGGEEFLLVFADTDAEQIPRLGERLRACVAAQTIELDGHRVHVTASLGLTAHPVFPDRPDLLSWQESIMLADMALYAAKAQGRDRWASYVPASDSPALPQDQQLDPKALISQGHLVLHPENDRP